MRADANVLIVDDDEYTLRVLEVFFQKHGCRVSLACDGYEGIEEVRQSRFDLIMLDLDMPRMTGLEALPDIRVLNPDARVVILTGRGTYESKVEAREHGIYDYLLKPIDLKKLKEVADRALPDQNRVDTAQTDLTSKKIPRDVAREISFRLARTFCLIAIEKDEDMLTVAMADPTDIVALDTVRAHTGCRIQPVQADRQSILMAIKEVY